MACTLQTDGAVRYSTGERGLFALLPKNGARVTSTALVKKFYRSGDRPYHDRKIVIGTMTSLIKKVHANKEPFRIVKSARSGPIPIEFWLEEK